MDSQAFWWSENMALGHPGPPFFRPYSSTGKVVTLQSSCAFWSIWASGRRGTDSMLAYCSIHWLPFKNCSFCQEFPRHHNSYCSIYFVQWWVITTQLEPMATLIFKEGEGWHCWPHGNMPPSLSHNPLLLLVTTTWFDRTDEQCLKPRLVDDDRGLY